MRRMASTVGDGATLLERGAVSRSRHRLALIGGMLCLGATLVLNVPGVADVRHYRSPAVVLAHVAMALMAFGLSPRFPAWVRYATALSVRQQILYFAAALMGPLVIMVEPLQFVLWLTAAWLAFERAGCDRRGSPDYRAFRLAGWAGIMLAFEEVDYLGALSLAARAAGVHRGRIGGHHFGGFHDPLNELGKASLVLSVVIVAAVVALVFLWLLSRGLHRVVWRETLSPTTLPLVGAVLCLGIAQLADMSHPVVGTFGDGLLPRNLREEPIELLAVVCVNASLLAKLTVRRVASPPPANGASA